MLKFWSRAIPGYLLELLNKEKGLVSWKTREVFVIDQNDIAFNTRCCESNIFQCHKKYQFYAFGDVVATGADQTKYFLATNTT